ncbi:hypothetical protein X777_14674 [Ooceraea biroi]|uniref:Reverse transcriptase zinc-binding domain-containing protein n=1 Tax=Ooceraea biroi TaxID=2015173 RepID=A0A026WR42_OOCBI|nr:hypothetical protein X777_14674 [Ooceraea biroi]
MCETWIEEKDWCIIKRELGSNGEEEYETVRKSKDKIIGNVWMVSRWKHGNMEERRWMLYRYLVHSVISYGVVIWGWSERKELEKIMEDYVRWVFRLDFCTPRYILRRELGIKKAKIEWGIRARKFEEKSRKEEVKEFVRRCWEEKDKRRKSKELYSKERENYYNRNGWGIGAVEEFRRNETEMEDLLRERELDLQKQMEEKGIREARYNARYRVLELGKDKPKYLLKENLGRVRAGDDVRALVRLRCGNMEDAHKYWIMENERKKCKFCEARMDNLKHYIEECEEVKEWFNCMGENRADRLSRLCNDEL